MWRRGGGVEDEKKINRDRYVFKAQSTMTVTSGPKHILSEHKGDGQIDIQREREKAGER